MKIEKLAFADGLHLAADDAITSGFATVQLVAAIAEPATPAVTATGTFRVARAGTGTVAEIGVAHTFAEDTELNVADVNVALRACVKRTLAKNSTVINIEDTLATAADANGDKVRKAADFEVQTVGAGDSDNISTFAAGVVTFKSEATEDTDYLIELPFASGAASDPNASKIIVKAGSYHINILARLTDDVEISRMHNDASMTFVKVG